MNVYIFLCILFDIKWDLLSFEFRFSSVTTYIAISLRTLLSVRTFYCSENITQFSTALCFLRAVLLPAYWTQRVEKPSECLQSSEKHPLNGQSTMRDGHFTSSKPTHYHPATCNYIHCCDKYLDLWCLKFNVAFLKVSPLSLVTRNPWQITFQQRLFSRWCSGISLALRLIYISGADHNNPTRLPCLFQTWYHDFRFFT